MVAAAGSPHRAQRVRTPTRLRHGGVEGEAAVVGVPDAKWEERPLACIVAKPGATVTDQAVHDFLSDKVAKWWLPERYAFVDEIPKTSVGKFDKKVLRKQYAAGELTVIKR